MSTRSMTFTASGTFAVPSAALGTTVQVEVGGECGFESGFFGSAYGHGQGAVVKGTVPVVPGTTTLTVTIGKHLGGVGGTGTRVGGHGGKSTALLNGASLLVEAAGGGGDTGDNISQVNGGNAGTPNGKMSPSNDATSGGGATTTTDGAGGGHVGTGSSGSPGSSGVGGAGGNTGTGGGGGGGGIKGGGGGGSWQGVFVFNNGGGGGATFVDPSVAGVTENATNNGAPYVTITWQETDAPLASVLVSPTNAAFVDSNAAGVTFAATYQTNGSAGALEKVALRVSKDGAAYGYWNGTDFTSTTPQWVVPTSGIGVGSGGSFSVAIPAAVLADGHTYTWSFACQEATLHLQGVFASDFAFTAAAQPTITSLVPVTSSGSVTPIVAWTATLGSGDSQISYRYIIYGIPSSPGTPGALYDSGVVVSAATSFTLPGTVGLMNGGTYYSYLQIVETGPNASQWVEATFTVVLDGPAQPTIVVANITDPTTGMPEPQISIVENDNLMPATDSSFETGTVGSFTATNATLTTSSSWSVDGSSSLQASSTASGAVTATEGTTSPCVPGQIVTAMATVQQPALTQTITLNVRFLNSSGGTISTVAIASAAASSAGVALSGQSTAAPAGTASCVLVFTYTATGATQLTRFDKLAIFLGTVSTWSLGGFVGIATAEVEASYDGGNTWADLRFGASVALTSQSGVAIDYESPFNVLLSYRVRIAAVVAGQTVVSPWSSVVTITIGSTYWWIIDPVTPTDAMQLMRIQPGASATTPANLTASLVPDRTERQGRFNGFGSQLAVVVRGDIWADEFDLGLYFGTDAEWQQFDSIRNNQTTLLLKSDMSGDLYYTVLGSQRPVAILSESGRQGNPRRSLLIHVTPVAVP